MSKPLNEKTVDIPQELVWELLTDSEIRMIKQRFLILNLLDEGLSIRSIASQVEVGTDTVVRLSRLAERKGLLKNPRNTRKKVTPQVKTNKTSWVFGKSE